MNTFAEKILGNVRKRKQFGLRPLNQETGSGGQYPRPPKEYDMMSQKRIWPTKWDKLGRSKWSQNGSYRN